MTAVGKVGQTVKLEFKKIQSKLIIESYQYKHFQSSSNIKITIMVAYQTSNILGHRQISTIIWLIWRIRRTVSYHNRVCELVPSTRGGMLAGDDIFSGGVEDVGGLVVSVGCSFVSAGVGGEVLDLGMVGDAVLSTGVVVLGVGGCHCRYLLP